MTPSEFVKSDRWKHLRTDVDLETLAVMLPVLLYALGLGAGHILSDRFTAAAAVPKFDYLLGIPDGLFGACILFAFGAIQGFRYRGPGTELGDEVSIHDKICTWRNLSLAGLIICSVLSALAVMFHPRWALLTGLISIYGGFLAYKKLTLFRSYVETHGAVVQASSTSRTAAEAAAKAKDLPIHRGSQRRRQRGSNRSR